MHSNMQQPYAPDLEDLIVEKISYYCNVDMNKTGTIKKAIWMNGKMCGVSDGTCLVNKRARKRCHPKGEAAVFILIRYPQ